MLRSADAQALLQRIIEIANCDAGQCSSFSDPGYETPKPAKTGCCVEGRAKFAGHASRKCELFLRDSPTIGEFSETLPAHLSLTQPSLRITHYVKRNLWYRKQVVRRRYDTVFQLSRD